METKDVNNFISKNFFGKKEGTFKERFEEYQYINKRIKEIQKSIEQYEKLDDSNENELTFKEKLFLYNMIQNAILNSNNSSDFDVDLNLLKQKFTFLNQDLFECLNLKEKLDHAKTRRYELLTEEIDFSDFDKEHYSEHCRENHCFVEEDNELKCVYCGATTKDYPLTREEFKFLVSCAKRKGLLLDKFTKEDWPFIKLIIEKQDYRRSLRPKLDMDAEDFLEKLEVQSYEDSYEISELQGNLAVAHLLDAKIYKSEETRISDPKYLTPEQQEKLLNNIEREEKEIEKSNSKFKDLLLEQCQTAKYEVLILSGEHIPTLLKNASDESEKIALTKAYYNISNPDFRINSGYFDAEKSNATAMFYQCYTANQEINNKILEMKLKR